MRLKRRGFLIGAGAALVVPLMRQARATDKRGSFTAEEQETLLQLAKDLFPHKKIGDLAYRGAIEPLIATQMPAPRLKNYKEGMARLERGGTPWRKRKQAERVAQIKQIERTPFFADIRASVMVGLYANPQVVGTFGYSGASIEQGGWIDRGYDDLAWLPNPS